MTEKIEKTFRGLVIALQKARLYGTDHVKFRESIPAVYENLLDLFRHRNELVIGLVGNELAFEKEIFFDLSRLLQPVIEYLTSRGIERISFSQGLTLEELERFVVFLAVSSDQNDPDPQVCLEQRNIRNITVGKLGVAGGEEKDKDKAGESVFKIYEDSLSRFSSAIDALLTGEKADVLSVRMTLNNITEMLTGRYQEFLKLATVKRYDAGTFVHLMNVAILGMYFSAKLGFPKEDVNEIGMAGLFHDIGKLYISRKIITKPGKLTEEEFDRIRSHSSLGAEILLEYSSSLGVLPSVVAFEHHLKYDLKGYPRLAVRRSTLTASKIIAICDVYDALSQRRSYKNDYPPNVIYDIMIKDRGTSFDPELLDSFFRIMGVWPVGTLLKLSDGRIAVVRDENPDDIFHPLVEVQDAQGAKEILDLRKLAGTVEVERALNPLTDGKEYLALI